MFYRLNENGTIKDSAKFKYADDCLETTKNIVVDFNGQLVFEEETQNENYKQQLQNFTMLNERKIEIENLKNWFDVEYTRQEQKLRRLNTLGLLCEDGTRPSDRLIDLYNVAETKRKRIQELEGLINE